jgi:hypothetical protein
LAWAYISVNVLFLALFFGGVGVVVLYIAFVVWRLLVQDRAREAMAHEATGGKVPAPAQPRSLVIPVSAVPMATAASRGGDASPNTATMAALSPVYPPHVRSPASTSPPRAERVPKECTANEDGKADVIAFDGERDPTGAPQARPSLRHRSRHNSHVSADDDDDDGDGEWSMSSFQSFGLESRSRAPSYAAPPADRGDEEEEQEGHDLLNTLPAPSEVMVLSAGLRRRLTSTGSQSSRQSFSSMTSGSTMMASSPVVRTAKKSLRHGAAHSMPPPSSLVATPEPMFFAHELPDDRPSPQGAAAAPRRPTHPSPLQSSRSRAASAISDVSSVWDLGSDDDDDDDDGDDAARAPAAAVIPTRRSTGNSTLAMRPRKSSKTSSPRLSGRKKL